MSIEWLLYSVMVIPAYGMVLRLFFTMIEEGGALDVVFGWQKMLARLYSGNKAQQLIGKALGDCKVCTSFWFAIPWFFLYWSFSHILFGYYPTMEIESWFWKITFHVFWYIVIHAVAATVGMVILMIKIRKDKKGNNIKYESQ